MSSRNISFEGYVRPDGNVMCLDMTLIRQHMQF